MNYLLVKSEDLDAQGYPYQYAERIPDGRVILPISALKVLSNFTPEVLDEESLKALIRQQREQQAEEQPTEEEVAVDEGFSVMPPQEETTDQVEEGGKENES